MKTKMMVALGVAAVVAWVSLRSRRGGQLGYLPPHQYYPHTKMRIRGAMKPPVVMPSRPKIGAWIGAATYAGSGTAE